MRRVAVVMACELGVELPTEVTVRLATHPDARLRYWATALPGLPDETLLSLAQDPDPRVRSIAIGPRSWARLRPEVRAAAEADPDPRVREAVGRATRVERPLPTTVEDFLTEEDDSRRRDAAYAAPVDAAPAQLLVAHEDSGIRRGAACNPHVPTALALPLAADPDASVRFAVSLRGDLTEGQRAAIDYTVPEGRHPVPAWVRERFGDPDALRETAASSHVLLRRGVTCAPELPADVIERLAADDDYFVKLMLCENDHAPHELLVEMFVDWQGLSSGQLVYRRNFARPGLARFADDPNPWLRYAALFDPEGGPERLMHQLLDLAAVDR
ncbi:PE-PGRS family protein [Streptomyces himastatinicus ATCC 53653]|uniref:PE-PGRS family protein n=1 Tax=Streptomyces himastatinicus ATCC 53653 TaxID=457427 RepID=D9W6G5_9ACTN|nr:HEAT repeat domain-containing protein [Streptomyces himastatinicus]EFL22496.1 PE-PGRS family protein [Streptomyces himastatinicus ATCC 53653]